MEVDHLREEILETLDRVCLLTLLLTVRFFYLRLVFVAYRNLALSSLLAVEIWFGLFAYSENWIWSSLLTVPPRPKMGFGFFCLQFPLCR